MHRVHAHDDAQFPDCGPREAIWADLQRTMGFDSAAGIVQAESRVKHASQELDGEARHGYFHPGGYAGGGQAVAGNRFAQHRRPDDSQHPAPWEAMLPDPGVRLDHWVQCEMSRVGLPHWMTGVVLRMALVTMRDGVEVAGRTLLEERRVAEEFQFAIESILKQIPPLI
jgi:hypothetical protein